ncbi:MAG: DOMON-like domain-containing protein [Gallionellaceae bacterium]|nr:DOMON-like domain-containing protein [Gallionellaceae bacterium]
MIDLIRHGDFPAPWLRGIRVNAELATEGLSLRYRLAAGQAHLVIPDTATPERVEGLWRHTCFEAFVMGAGTSAYREFNFSPSGAWQAYGFHAYRQGEALAEATAPRIERGTETELDLRVFLPAQVLPPGPRLRLGLSAVIEAVDGSLSYWALRHPPGRPDFHHSDCFALELARP